MNPNIQRRAGDFVTTLADYGGAHEVRLVVYDNVLGNTVEVWYRRSEKLMRGEWSHATAIVAFRDGKAFLWRN